MFSLPMAHLFLLLVVALFLLPPFSVPDVSHVPRLTMNLFSAAQLTDSGCRVILDVDSCSVQDADTFDLD